MDHRPSFKLSASVLFLATCLALASCGGGSDHVLTTGGDVVTTAPSQVTLSAGGTRTYAVNGGMPPYDVESDNPNIARADLTGGVLTLMAGSPGSVPITITDRNGQRAVINMTVTRAPAATGLYRGTTSTGRSAAAILFDNGEFWLLYTAVNNPQVVAGAEQGVLSLDASGKAAGTLRDYNLEGLGTSSGTLTGTFIARQSSTGTVSFPNSTVTFNAVFDATSAVPASLTQVTGTYSGRAATAAGFDNATFSVSSTGAFVGSTTLGCRFSGTAAPDAGINAYHVTVTFAGGNCSNGTDTVTGAAYFDPSTRTLYAAGLNAPQTNGVLFTGVKQ